MSTALLVARLFLALVFVVAGVSKLADLRGSRQAMLEFGASAALAPFLGVALPLIELAIALALIPEQSAWGAAIAALLLLCGFIAAIGINLARGRRPDCHCFGQVYSEPIGASTLVRNGIFTAVAAFVVWQGHGSARAGAIGWLGDLSPAEAVAIAVAVIALALVAAEGWLLLNLMHMNGRLLLRVEALEGGDTSGTEATSVPAAPGYGLPVGVLAPEFSLPTLGGETVTLAALRARGKPVLLVFGSLSCGPCAMLLPEIGRWQTEHSDLTVALITSGSAEENRSRTAPHGISTVLLQQADEVAQAYQSPGTPSAVLVAPDGTMAAPLMAGVEGIRTLVANSGEAPAVKTDTQIVPLLGEIPQRPTVIPGAPVYATPGQPAPPIRLPDLRGATVDLSDFRGHATVVIFWNPGCSFCETMLPDLQAWERVQPAGAPRLLVVSAGLADDVVSMRLESTVVLDPAYSAAKQYGASGTPMAVLIDADGNVASPLAGGATPVLALARGDVKEAFAPPPPNAVGAASGGAPTIGDPAPTVELSGTTGKLIRLTDFLGKTTLLLFWNTGCGFCQRMLPDLKAWEAARPEWAPEILVISAGPESEVRAMGLQSPVALDPQSTVSPRFGANGTPMAVLIDAAGRIASPTAAGADEVLQLAASDAVLVSS